MKVEMVRKMINTFSINSSSLKRGDSLVPEFYYYANILKQENLKKGIKYKDLAGYVVSDGEHSAIPRIEEPGVRYLYGRNIREACIDFDPISDIPYIDVADYEKIKRTHIKQNDVLIPIVGTIGKSAIYKEEYVGLAGIPRHIAHITIPEEDKITPEYLSVFFRSKYGKTQLFSLSTGNIQPLLSLKNLKSVEVPLASESFIKTITENESKANNLLIKANKKLKEAFRLFYSFLGFDIKAIKGDFAFTVNSNKIINNDVWTPNHYNTLFDNIGQKIKECLKVIPLGFITSSFHGVEVGSNNYNEYLEKDKSDKPFIRTSDLVNYEIDLYPDFFVSENIYDDITNLPQEGDVLFTKDGKIGATAMITKNDECIASSGIQIFRLNEKGKELNLTNEYLFIVLSVKEIGYYEAIKRTVVASTIPHLRPERMKEIPIPILEKEKIDNITALVKEAFELKNERKPLLKANDELFESFFK